MKQPIKWIIMPVIRCTLKAESIRPKVALTWPLRTGHAFPVPRWRAAHGLEVWKPAGLAQGGRGWRGTQPVPGWELAGRNGIGPSVPRKVGTRLFLEALKGRRGLKLI